MEREDVYQRTKKILQVVGIHKGYGCKYCSPNHTPNRSTHDGLLLSGQPAG